MKSLWWAFLLGIAFWFAVCKVCWGQELTASWYSESSLKKEGTYGYSNGIMANGGRFYDSLLSCASWDYPLRTVVSVTNAETGRATCVEVTDRTARRFKGKRIDLSKLAFSRIGKLEDGLIPVTVEVVNAT